MDANSVPTRVTMRKPFNPAFGTSNESELGPILRVYIQAMFPHGPNCRHMIQIVLLKTRVVEMSSPRQR